MEFATIYTKQFKMQKVTIQNLEFWTQRETAPPPSEISLLHLKFFETVPSSLCVTIRTVIIRLLNISVLRGDCIRENSSRVGIQVPRLALREKFVNQFGNRFTFVAQSCHLRPKRSDNWEGAITDVLPEAPEHN